VCPSPARETAPGFSLRGRGAQNLLEGAAENIAKRAAQLAEEGNVAAIRICMNRLSPVGQHNPVAFELPPIHSTQDWWDEEEESEGHVRLRVERMIAQGKARPDDRFFYVSWRLSTPVVAPVMCLFGGRGDSLFVNPFK
jgi:hypothetical protein